MMMMMNAIKAISRVISWVHAFFNDINPKVNIDSVNVFYCHDVLSVFFKMFAEFMKKYMF